MASFFWVSWVLCSSLGGTCGERLSSGSIG